MSAFPAQQATHVFVFNTAAQEGTTQDAKALRKRGGAFLLDTFLSFKAISMACTMHARSESLPLQLTSQENPEDMKEPMERMRWWELTFPFAASKMSQSKHSNYFGLFPWAATTQRSTEIEPADCKSCEA